jgi:hypothetical protein
MVGVLSILMNFKSQKYEFSLEIMDKRIVFILVEFLFSSFRLIEERLFFLWRRTILLTHTHCLRWLCVWAFGSELA